MCRYFASSSCGLGKLRNSDRRFWQSGYDHHSWYIGNEVVGTKSWVIRCRTMWLTRHVDRSTAVPNSEENKMGQDSMFAMIYRDYIETMSAAALRQWKVSHGTDERLRWNYGPILVFQGAILPVMFWEQERINCAKWVGNPKNRLMSRSAKMYNRQLRKCKSDKCSAFRVDFDHQYCMDVAHTGE